MITQKSVRLKRIGQSLAMFGGQFVELFRKLHELLLTTSGDLRVSPLLCQRYALSGSR